MFSQRKKFYEKRSFYIGLIAVLVVFGIWINHTPEGSADDEGILISDSQTQLEDDDKKEDSRQGTSSQNGIQTNKRVGTSQGSLDERGAPLEIGKDDQKDGGTNRDGADPDLDPDRRDGVYNQWTDYPYYLIQEEESRILVYYLDADGKESLYRTTGISYSLLAEADQQLFREGIRLETEEEVMDLLQDFES